ncbi:homoserine O-succinyltransferase [Brucella endophytica]|uniref:Homoserine O-acetyltransferase n=1 Tax=Brucella endophytica TaxID=1963359 RepID=A0A916SC70_9HYPH|nr:homoserine O-succinyltransferase [Brucella endophytica]GGA90851.1 homoserine O-succinyltransferase [Brucella endophytica]
MPIKIPDELPAREVLVREGVSVMDERTALRQDIRPLQIGLLNLMPNKIRTETQFARLIGASPLQVELTLVRIGNHKAKNTPEEHLITFYQTWEEIADRKFDGFIVTGAPVELLPFEDVTYWDELTRIFEWTTTNVHSSFFICWGAMAAAWHFHRLPKYTLEKKAFGVFRHSNNAPASPYLAGFSDDFSIPVSRWTEVRAGDIPPGSGLDVLIESDETGPCLMTEPTGNRLYMFNHIEYDSTSLKEEYDRDVSAGVPVELPHEYFPGDNPLHPPLNRWRSHAHLLFGNWINRVYQTTEYDLAKIGSNR